MTQTATDSAFLTPAAKADSDAGESFLGVVWRRTRYTVAIVLSAALFCWIGWRWAAPPADWAGVSPVTWQSQGYFSGFYLAITLLGLTALCSFLVHPDSPHMGLFCALLGMAGLSIRGGNVHLLWVYAQRAGVGGEQRVADGMAIECLMWGCVALLADSFARLLHDRFFANNHWLFRSNPLLAKKKKAEPSVSLVDVSNFLSRFLHTEKIKGPIRIPIAMIWSGGIAFLLLYIFMQTQLKGQVLLACFEAFLISTLCAYFAFPTVPFWAIILAVPLTGAAGYVLGRNGVPLYPGQAPYFAMRALPIDYLTVGVPGAILGYYWGFGVSLSSAAEAS